MAQRKNRGEVAGKWEKVFQRLNDAIRAAHSSSPWRAAALEFARQAREEALKHTHNYRRETSMGATVAEVIQKDIIDCVDSKAMDAGELEQVVSALRKFVYREATVARVRRVQNHLRMKTGGKVSDAARERAVGDAIEKVVALLGKGK